MHTHRTTREKQWNAIFFPEDIPIAVSLDFKKDADSGKPTKFQTIARGNETKGAFT